jgi:hypothetical protein
MPDIDYNQLAQFLTTAPQKGPTSFEAGNSLYNDKLGPHGFDSNAVEYQQPAPKYVHTVDPVPVAMNRP